MITALHLTDYRGARHVAAKFQKGRFQQWAAKATTAKHRRKGIIDFPSLFLSLKSHLAKNYAISCFDDIEAASV